MCFGAQSKTERSARMVLTDPVKVALEPQRQSS